MTPRTILHHVQCTLFVIATASAHLVPALPPERRGQAYIALHLLLTVLMLGVWGTGSGSVSGAYRSTLVAGVLARVVLLGVPTFTTTDVERYLWDGRVLLAGHDPYQLAPDAAELSGLRATWPTPPEHAGYPTIYPPGALLLFAVAAWSGTAYCAIVWKLLVTAASLVMLWTLGTLARERKVDRHMPLVALSPLLILEGGVGSVTAVEHRLVGQGQ